MLSRLDQALRSTEPDVWRQLVMPSCLDSGTCLGYCPCMARRFMVDLWAATSKISSSSLELSEFSPSCARDPLTLAVPAIPDPLCCCCCCCKYFIRSTRDILDTSVASAHQLLAAAHRRHHVPRARSCGEAPVDCCWRQACASGPPCREGSIECKGRSWLWLIGPCARASVGGGC